MTKLAERLFSGSIRVSWHQNVSTPGFTRAKENRGDGDNCSYRTSKAKVKLSPPIKQHPFFYTLDALRVIQPTGSNHWRENVLHSTHLFTPSSSRGLPTLSLTVKGSRLPCRRVAKPLISLVTPLPYCRAVNISLQASLCLNTRYTFNLLLSHTLMV